MPATLRTLASRVLRRAPLLQTLLALATVVGVGCADGTPITGPARPTPSLAVAAGTLVFTIPFDAVGYSPCGNGGAGEQVALHGELLIAYGSTESASGTTRYRLHSQPRNVTGVGLTTGTAYRLVGTDDHGYTDPVGPGEQATLTSSFRLLAAGAEDDLHVHTTAHVTIAANGTRTADVATTSYECR